jgi:predicted MPP superfamily phosphohydrolase
MRLALETLRGTPCPPQGAGYNYLGFTKYGLAAGAALLWAAGAWALRLPLLPPLAALVFYVVEAQMVFLFPLALDGSARPFRTAWAWTRRAGGTLAVLRVVLPLASVMLLGGLVGRGFVRSWCLGCLAVCLWYEDLRLKAVGDAGAAPIGTRTAARRGRGLEFGSFRPLFVRREAVHLGLARPLCLLYASDLHLGHWWTRRVAEQLLHAAQETRPDFILLGGDLADNAEALAQLGACVRAVGELAPVLAIPGNHDRRAGIPNVRATILAAGGHWLPDRPVHHGLRIDGTIDPAPCDGPRLLCAHYPSDFPAARAAGYRVVLAGHLHGGQCLIATRRGRLYPAAWIHRWHGLRFTEDRSVMLVSRGAGDTLPLRFNCPREVILCAIA